MNTLLDVLTNSETPISKNCSEDHRISEPVLFGGFPDKEVGKNGEKTGSIVIRDLYMGATPTDIMDLFPAYYIPNRTSINQIYNEIQERTYGKLPIVKEVHWFYGDTGSGKSFKALRENLTMAYVPNFGNSGTWFDNYNGEEVLFLDDLRAHNIPYNKLLQILDVQPFKCEGKGIQGMYARWKKIVITCPYHPSEFYSENVYKEQNDIDQVLRRIHLCISFKSDDEPLVLWDNRHIIPGQIAKYAKLVIEAEKNSKKWLEERRKMEEDALEIANKE